MLIGRMVDLLKHAVCGKRGSVEKKNLENSHANIECAVMDA